MKKQDHLPEGVYLPLRAWIAAPTEVVLLAHTSGQFFTVAFTPNNLLDHAEAGQNLFRDPGITQSSLCFWSRDLLKQFLRQVRRHDMKPWPAEDFRIQSDGQGIGVTSKMRFLTT